MGFKSICFVRTILISSSSYSAASSRNAAVKEEDWCLAISLSLYFLICLSRTSTTRSMDWYMSSVDSSARITLPFTGMVTSIFCISFCVERVTLQGVSAWKNLSNFPSFFSTIFFKPSVKLMVLPVMLNFIIESFLSLFFRSRSLYCKGRFFLLSV